MALPALTSDGVLPLGRWHATLGDVEDAFVTGQGARREEIWAHLAVANQTISRLVHVGSVWFSGSFFTNKTEPDDIDCVYFVDARTRPSTPVEAAAFDLFVGGEKLKRFGLRVDSYVVAWIYRPGVDLNIDAQVPLMWRGYWDDLWQRQRHGAKGSIHPDDGLPTRGFVEVTIDGFHATAP
ncbi:MAG: hypothetical protein M3Y77_17335 [Actinomycetota bacterium]|nr:hypothetical protein [Actinomycetota bacterium]MDQ2848068.1 hypothetical protein [Actinomycetota bacterium]